MTGSVRVLPLLVVAGLCLLALKSMGLLLSGGYVISGVAPAKAQDPKALAGKPVKADTTESVQPVAAARDAATGGEKDKPPVPVPGKEAATPAAPTDEKAGAGAADVQDTSAPKAATRVAEAGTDFISETPKAELAVLEGLSGRRKDLDKREQQLDLRENLMKAAEKRVESRIAELKAIQAKIEGHMKKQDDTRKVQYDNLVKMYSAMKPKDAAKIFDMMDIEVLTGLASQMKPRVMSAIMADMKPAAAERLTMELAMRGRPAPKTAAVLPKIEGQSTN